jgi:small subunit ribosomal protein S6
VAVHTYEALFLLDANRASADWDGVSGQVNGLIAKNGGEILFTRPWEVQKLAYPINRSRKGVYLLTYFKIDSTKIPAIEADCRINEMIVRKMIIKLHPRIAEQMLSHYTGEHHDERAEHPAEAAATAN